MDQLNTFGQSEQKEQTQLQQQSKLSSTQTNDNSINGVTTATITTGGITINTTNGTTTATQGNQPTQHNQSTSTTPVGHTLNIVKIEQKPVECNLCHRKFKNIPALNGHMRLHGGYFKKETETKKCEKKENNGPPLQTASIGVRALIEEKIISKRCKDLKGAFVVPAPPLATTIRRANEIENSFLTPKNPSLTISPSNNNTTATISLNTPTLTPTSTNQVSTTTATANQNVQIHATTLQLQKQTLQKITSISTISQGTSTESKDATLIELLKRGTKVAVKRTCSDPGQIFNATNGTQTILLPASSLTATSSHSNQINSNLSTNVSTNAGDLSISTPGTPNSTSRSPLSISLPNGETAPLALTISQAPNGAGDVFTLTYSTDSSSTFFSDSDVYSVSDTAMLLQAVDSIQLLNDSPSTDQLNQITSIADLQQLLKKESPSDQLTTDDNSNITLTSNGGGSISCVDDYTAVSNSKEIQDVLNSPLPDNIAEFSTFHSKDFVLYNCSNNSNSTTITQNNNSNSSNNTHCSAIGSPNASSSSPLSSQHQHHQSQPPSVSPLPSPLAYPTPPASHEAITQSSPFLDDSHHFPDASAFFDDKSSVNFITDSTSQFFKDNSDTDLTESEKILCIKNELFNESKSVLEVESGDAGANGAADAGDFETDVFDSHVKVEDLLNEATGDEQCDLKDFSDQNLSFLDEPESFLDDSRNPSSPLSESFFTSGIGSAEEVKEVLKDVLPNESLEETNVSESPCENDIDLYYLPGLTLQSQMMPNSDDPLLSSSPKDFGHHKIFLQQINPQQQIISQQPNPQQHLIVQPIQTQQQQSTNNIQQQLQKFDPIQLFTCATTTSNQKNSKLNESVCAFPLNSTATNVVTMIGNNNCQQLHPQQQQLQQHLSNYTALTTINSLQNNGAFASTVHQPQQKDSNCIILANTSGLETFLNTPSSTATASQSTLPTIINITSATCQNFNNFQQQQQQQQKIFNSSPSTTTLTLLPSTSQNNQKPNQTQQQNQQISTQTIAQTSQITSSILKRRLRQGSGPSSGNSNSFPKKQEVYRSKLRKPSTTHYTPAPILNPDRKGTGLYSNLPKSLMQETISLGDEFDDTASSLVAFLDDSKVNIGTAYQAQIPSYDPNKNEINNGNECPIDSTSQTPNFLYQQQQQNSNANYNQHITTTGTSTITTSLLSSFSKETTEDYDELMWDPNINENRNSDCDEKTLNRFIELTKSSGAPLGFHTEEVALKALLDANGFTHIAVLTLLQSPSNAVPEKWSANEIEAFLKGLEKYGKDFYRISNDLKTKTTKECIQLYYFWKKLCVDYKVTHLKQDTCDTSDETSSQMNSSHSNTEHRPYVCEMPDCSASFTSKAALHSHTRLHCIGRNHHFNNNNNNNNNLNNGNIINSTNINIQNNHNSNININNNIHNNNNNSNNNNGNSNSINNNNNQNHNNNQIGTKNIIISNNGNHHNNNNNSHNNNNNISYNCNDNNNNANIFQFGQPNNNMNNNHNSSSHQNSTTTTTIATTSIKDDFPCKVCGKVFNKVKSRSAHMKSHRPQDNDQLHNNNNISNNNNNNSYINNNNNNNNSHNNNNINNSNNIINHNHISIKLSSNTITNLSNINNQNNTTSSNNYIKKLNDNKLHHHHPHYHHNHHFNNNNNNNNNSSNSMVVTSST